MLHLLPKSHSPAGRSALDVEPAPAATGMPIDRPDTGQATTDAARNASSPVVISESEVLFNTAVAAAAVSPAMIHRHWSRAAFISAIGHIHFRLPEPRPVYPRRYASYFEDGRMSRMMEHL